VLAAVAPLASLNANCAQNRKPPVGQRAGTVAPFGVKRTRLIINFPTKGHWRSRSNLADIEAGLSDLHRVLIELDEQMCDFELADGRVFRT
jgi:hypothetical protein